jgi:hypothetical protein
MIAVKRSQVILSKLAYSFQRLLDMEAAWIPLVHSPELKLVLARKLYLDASAAKALLERLPELLAPALPVMTCSQQARDLDAAARLVDEADIAAFLVATEKGLHRVLTRFTGEHFPIGDEPSLRLIKC